VQVVCEGTCSTSFADKGADCSDNGGKRCDGLGSCVACLTSSDCPNTVPTGCLGNVFHGLATCGPDGACVPGDIQDCSLTKQVCKSGGCGACTSDNDCNLLAGVGCKIGKCDINQGVCVPSNLAQGAACMNTPGVCNGSGTCVTGKYVFVTEGTIDATFGGAMHADDKCTALALNAKLGGQWWAWVSDAQVSPATRFNPPPAGPFRKLNDHIVANDWAQLTSGMLMEGIDITEKKTMLLQGEVWTGTKPSGVNGTATCNDWMINGSTQTMGLVGLSGAIDANWTAAKSEMCTVGAHLYCFQL
jgi:hypothetical protein